MSTKIPRILISKKFLEGPKRLLVRPEMNQSEKSLDSKCRKKEITNNLLFKNNNLLLKNSRKCPEMADKLSLSTYRVHRDSLIVVYVSKANFKWPKTD